MTPVFFDTEFSSLFESRVWSVGLVTLQGRNECYAELDPESHVGRQRLAAIPRDVNLRRRRALDFEALLRLVGTEQEGWPHEWLASPSFAFGHQISLDLLEGPDGSQLVGDALGRIEHGTQ